MKTKITYLAISFLGTVNLFSQSIPWATDGNTTSSSSNPIIGFKAGNYNLNFQTNGKTRMHFPSGSSQETVTIGTAPINPYYYKFEVNQGRSAFLGPNGNDQYNLMQLISGYNNPTFPNGSIHYMSFSHERFNNNEEHGVINTVFYQNPNGPATPRHMLFQKSSGNVGIGAFSTAPTEKLEVNGNIKASGDIIFANGKSLTQELANIPTRIPDGTVSNFWTSANNQIGFGNIQISSLGASPYLTIIDRNVGLNFNKGDRFLQIGDDAFLTDVDEANTLAIYGIQNKFSATIKLGENGANLKYNNRNLAFTNTKVSIGTENAPNDEYMLRVNGKILTKGLKCQVTGWADYVFKSDYKLMRLSEIEEYILKNHHLPNIPSENQVLEEGIDMAEMNKMLLEKVEELTLYLIELEKQVIELKNK